MDPAPRLSHIEKVPSDMTYRILTAAALCVAFAAPALAQSTIARSETHCARDGRSYNCRYEYDSKYSNTTTWCASGRQGRHCETETKSKAPPLLEIPELPQSVPEGQVDPALYGGIPEPNDPAELGRQRERGKREAEAARRPMGSLKIR